MAYNLPFTDQLHERFKGSLEFAHYMTAHNRDTQFKATQQSGGTLMITNGDTTARVCSTEYDHRRLGRWCSVLLRGNHNTKVRIVTVYRPVFSKGALSAYQQHKCALLNTDIDTCPRQQILVDLRVMIEQWKADGEQLIIAGEFNEDVRGHTIKSFFDSVEMHELLLNLHPSATPTNTFVNGTAPIDGIFGTFNLQPVVGGYTSFEWGMNTDHRMLWVDFPMEHLFGGNLHLLWKPQIRRLKCQDPRIVNRFIKLWKIHYERSEIEAKFSECLHLLHSDDSAAVTGDLSDQLNDIDELRTQGMLWAERKCRKLKMGNVPWSPAIQKCMNTIKYLNCCRL